MKVVESHWMFHKIHLSKAPVGFPYIASVLQATDVIDYFAIT